ncbi:ARL14 effector protein [Schistosoma japonicum]|nr:ARL14 effector protein [Schistosoma japonicum]
MSSKESPSSWSLSLHSSARQIFKARKSSSGGHRNYIVNLVKENNNDNSNSSIGTPGIENRELDRLKFANPGRQMEELKVGWFETNVTRSVRRQMAVKCNRKSSDRLHPLYDSRGRLLETLEYKCDCLKPKCPGCHLPCRRCHSTFCGASCRIYRTYRVSEVSI